MNLAQWFEENPQLLGEWDSEANTDISPENVGYTSKFNAWWVCKEGHRWESTI